MNSRLTILIEFKLNFKIKSLPFGAYILTVNATDDDKGTNGEILYYLDEKRVKNDDWKRFNLDPKTGVLTLNTKLNINQQSVYSVSFF